MGFIWIRFEQQQQQQKRNKKKKKKTVAFISRYMHLCIEISILSRFNKTKYQQIECSLLR